MCGANHLMLNVTKAREMVVDDYKYLGIPLDNELDWNFNTEAL